MGAIHVPARLLVACVLAASLGGCFLVGLSDDIGQSSCESDADCGSLEAEDTDPCMAWQCQPDSERGGSDYCQYTRLDADHDGVLASSAPGPDGEAVQCGESGEVLDCDDSDDERRPMYAEKCDGIDNDCDEQVDEGALGSTSNTAVLFTDDVSQIDFATNVESGSMAVVYVSAAGDEPGASMVALDTTEAKGGRQIPLSVKDVTARTPVVVQIGAAALDNDHFAVAFFDNSGDERLMAGLLARGDVTDSTRITLDPDVYRWGLACAEGEACAGNAAQPEVTISHPRTGQPALATSSNRVLLAYQRQPQQAAPNCGEAPMEDAEPTVMVNLLSKPAARDVLVDSAPSALVLGKSREADQPAVLALPDLDGVSGFLVAMTDLAGAIVVHHVSPGDAGPVGVLTDISIEDSVVSGAALGRPAMAVTGAKDGSAVLTVAYRAGCEGDSTIEARLFTLSASGEALVARPLAGPFTVGDENAADRPVVAHSPTRDLWAITYRSPNGLHARLLKADGTPRGTEAYLLIPGAPMDGDRQHFLHNPTIFPLDATNGLFGAAGLVRNDVTGEYSVALARVDTCGT